MQTGLMVTCGNYAEKKELGNSLGVGCEEEALCGRDHGELACKREGHSHACAYYVDKKKETATIGSSAGLPAIWACHWASWESLVLVGQSTYLGQTPWPIVGSWKWASMWP